ncbi:hypothetical protein ALISP_1749 [Alicycliphilus sp. B1]|nr:hypothetical protein ALISP_1749 [Alicycliphilus sp. B1]
MFSIMTMASSTTKPVEMVSAISVRLLIEKPARYITPKVPMSDNGTAKLGISVAVPLLRNTKITATTSATASSSSCCMSRTDARMVTVRSVSTWTCSDAGSVSSSCGSSAFTAVHRLDHVGAGLALDVEDHGRLGAIVRRARPGRQARVLGVVHGIRHGGPGARGCRCGRR